jgi:hypothetical protein
MSEDTLIDFAKYNPKSNKFIVAKLDRRSGTLEYLANEYSFSDFKKIGQEPISKSYLKDVTFDEAVSLGNKIYDEALNLGKKYHARLVVVENLIQRTVPKDSRDPMLYIDAVVIMYALKDYTKTD